MKDSKRPYRTDWSQQPLGRVRDDEVAAKVGCKIQTVSRARIARRIAAFSEVCVCGSTSARRFSRGRAPRYCLKCRPIRVRGWTTPSIRNCKNCGGPFVRKGKAGPSAHHCTDKCRVRYINKATVGNLSDVYIKKLLGIKRIATAAIPAALIDLKRTQIRVERLIKHKESYQ